MSFEAINAIKECEIHAKEIMTSADEQAKKIVREAKIEGQDLLQKIESDTKTKAEQMISENDTRLISEREIFKSDLEIKTEEVYKRSSANKEKAVDFIVKSIIATGVN